VLREPAYKPFADHMINLALSAHLWSTVMTEDIDLGSFTDFAFRPDPNGSGVDARIEFAGGERVQLTIPPG
jgi:hypothetical protein